jgi:hypothetical protein
MWEEVDFMAKVLRVPASRTKPDCKLDLPMTDVVHGLLVARIQVAKPPVVRGSYVFPANSSSGYIADPRGWFARVAEKSHVTVSSHDLRRTYITAAQSCVSVYELKALVNHSLGDDVTGGYVMMNVEHLRAPAQKVCDKLKEWCRIAPVAGDNVVKLNK